MTQRIVRRLKDPSDPPLEVHPNMEFGAEGAEDPIEAALMVLAEAVKNEWFIRMTRFDEQVTVEWWREKGWRPGFKLDRGPGVSVMTVVKTFAGILPTGPAPESRRTLPSGHFKFDFGERQMAAHVEPQPFFGGEEIVLVFDDGHALEYALASGDEKERICEDWKQVRPLMALAECRTRIAKPGMMLDSTPIGNAIEDTPPGTRVIVCAGYYEETLDISDSVQILGMGAERVHVAGTRDTCLRIRSGKTLIRGIGFELNLRRGRQPRYAVEIMSGESVIECCEMRSNSAACVGVAGEHASPTLRACTIHHGSDCGVRFDDRSTGRLENCDIVDNAKTGVRIVKGAGPVIVGCRIQRNGSWGVSGDASSQGKVEGCDLTGNVRGAFGLVSGHSVTGRDNLV